MKRDMDLIRTLLLWIEDDPTLDGREWRGVQLADYAAFPGHSPQEVQYHLGLLVDAGLVQGKPYFSPAGTVVFSSLTWGGHEFVDNVRDASIWKVVKEKASGVSGVAFGVLGEIAKEELKKRLGLK